MVDHTRIKCPCCGKQLYLVTVGDEDEPIVFVSMFFPSPADIKRAEQAGPRPLTCPLTGKEIDLDEARSNLMGSHHDTTVVIRRRSEAEAVPELPRPQPPGEAVPTRSAPAPSPADVSGLRDEHSSGAVEAPASSRVASILAQDREQRIVRCAECRVMFDLQQTAVCPRCGATPPPEEDEAAAADTASSGRLTGRVRKRKDPGIGEVDAGEESAPRGRPRADDDGGLVLLFLKNGRSIAVFFVLAVAASTALSFLGGSELLRLVGTVVAAVLFVVAYILFVAYNRLRKIGFYRAKLEQVGAAAVPAGMSEALGDGEPAEGTARPAHVRLPASPTRIGDVRYLAGHPEAASSDSGELWAGPSGIEFQGAKQVLGMPARAIERVRASGGRATRIAALLFLVLAYFLWPSSPHDFVPSAAAPWSPSLHHYVFWAWVGGLVSIIGLLSILALGVLRARHHVLTVRYRAGEEHVDVRFGSSFVVVLRARQLIRSD